ncbi:MAG TPA: histidine phosphatase family protein [Acidimicrobiales bacterium]|nr:histidine phosphatase family protein [Acidimicrobiales bacterium]
MLILVRHGQSASNRAGRLSGRGDVDLDARGEDQARASGDVLSTLDVRRVIASPLRRAQRTAALLAIEGVTVETDERWVELDYGEWEGRPVADVTAAEWTRWRNDLEFEPPGGESIAALGRRVREACDALRRDARDGDVVVVSHVSPIKAAMAWALGVGDETSWRSHLSPGSITRIAARADRMSLLSWNEVGHLDR